MTPVLVWLDVDLFRPISEPMMRIFPEAPMPNLAAGVRALDFVKVVNAHKGAAFCSIPNVVLHAEDWRN